MLDLALNVSTNNTLDRDENVALIEVSVSATILVLAIVGNVCVLISLATRRKRLSRMHLMILHLSLADLFVAFFNVLPQLAWDITYRFEGGQMLCVAVKYCQVVAMYASSYVLLATAIDRYYAICHPFASHRWSARHAHSLVAVAWLASLVFSLPQVFIFSMTEVEPDSGVYDCWASFSPSWTLQLYISWMTASIFLIPTCMLGVLYGRITVAVWRAGRLQGRMTRSENSRKASYATHPHSVYSTSGKDHVTVVIRPPSVFSTMKTPCTGKSAFPHTGRGQTNSLARSVQAGGQSLPLSDSNGPHSSDTPLSTGKPAQGESFVSESSLNSAAAKVVSEIPAIIPVNRVRCKWNIPRNSFPGSTETIPRSSFPGSAERAADNSSVSPDTQKIFLDQGIKSLSTSAILGCVQKTDSPCVLDADMTSCSQGNAHYTRCSCKSGEAFGRHPFESSDRTSSCRRTQEGMGISGNPGPVFNSQGRNSGLNHCESPSGHHQGLSDSSRDMDDSGNSPFRTPPVSRSWSNLVVDNLSHPRWSDSVRGDQTQRGLTTSPHSSQPNTDVSSYTPHPAATSHLTMQSKLPLYKEDRVPSSGSSTPNMDDRTLERNAVMDTHGVVNSDRLDNGHHDNDQFITRDVSAHGSSGYTAQDLKLPNNIGKNLASSKALGNEPPREHTRDEASPNRPDNSSLESLVQPNHRFTEAHGASRLSNAKTGREHLDSEVCLSDSCASTRTTTCCANGRLTSGLSHTTGLLSRSGRSPSPHDQPGVPGISRAKLKTIKMTVTVVICYIVCWAPFFVGQMWAAFDEKAYQGDFLAIILLLASMNSCTNPWIYTVFSDSICRRTDQILRAPCACVTACFRRLGCRDTECRLPAGKHQTSERKLSRFSSTLLSDSRFSFSGRARAKRSSLTRLGGSMHGLVGKKGGDFKNFNKPSAREEMVGK